MRRQASASNVSVVEMTLPLRLRRPRPSIPGDAALAALLLVLAEIDAAVGGGWRGPRVFNALLIGLAAVALAWRRSRPLAALAVAAAVTVLQAVTYGSSDAATGFFIVVVAVYSAAAHARSVTAAVALTLAGTAAHDLGDPRIKTFGDAIYDSTMLGLVLLVGLAMRARQQRTRTLEADQEAREHAAVEEERRRIARELHDIVSHSLGVLVLQAGAAERVLDRDPERARAVLQSIRETGQDAIREMGTLLALVRGEAQLSRTPQPSLADVEQLVEAMRGAGVSAALTVEGEPRELPPALELSAYRIVQEGLTNAGKHARAATVRAVVRYLDDAVEVEVADDGSGSSAAAGARRGLAGIGERVSIFGGRFEAGPSAEGGWRVRAVLPTTR
jgi:signal transduction histidine kinase